MNKIFPILFNTDMVRAIMDGRKKVTRRICKDGNNYTVPDMSFYNADKRTYAVHNYADPEHIEKLSIGERTCPICPGDILYVRETVWQKTGHYLDVDGETKAVFDNEFRYVATDDEPEVGWNYSWVKRPSIHMPKEAARIWLKVKDVRVERLQDMSDDDCEKEGLENFCKKCSALFSNCDTCLNDGGIKEDFKELWNSTIKKSDLDRYGWDASPWVWVIEFERCEKPKE
ncbi:MAG: hypothetical protein PUF61_00020 [Spirochaetales bacterium]|nr:hypothetical protein [Spirochaetales bacterium]